jgi:predicted ATPase/DNA-binding CsgD family transcriptional regulator
VAGLCYAPMGDAGGVPHNLPRELTSLVGRGAAAVEVARLLETAPLVSLVGVGGAGKTRLATRVAHDRIALGGRDVVDGVWLVELASLADPSLVQRGLAAVLGVPDQPAGSIETSIVEAIGARRMLLVLDNCEHVVAECASLAERLLDAAPGLRLLVTSREALGVAGEVIWAVPALTLPASDDADAVAASEAGQLFVERASAVRRGFQLGPDTAAAIAHICRQLDGIPLAIELAAARCAALGPADIAARLDDVLNLLVGGRRNAPTRQQSLQAAIEWSYQLLDDRERWLFECLSVFAGGFDLAAAEGVSQPPAQPARARPETVAVLERLVSKSLVEAEPLSDGSMRYRLLEPIRQFAREWLVRRGTLADARRRHARHMLTVAEVGGPALRGRDQLVWHRRLERERDNFRAASEYARAAADSELGLRLAAALWWWWVRPDRRTEGRAQLEAALALPPLDGQAGQRATVLCAVVGLAGMQGDLPAASAWLEQARQTVRDVTDVEVQTNLLTLEGMLHGYRGDIPTARAIGERGLDLARQAGLVWWEARHLHNLADLALASNDAQAARELIGECLRIARDAGDLWNEAMALNGLGDVLRSAGDYVQAERVYTEAAMRFSCIEEHGGMVRGAWAGLPHNLGYVTLAQGATARATAHFSEAAERYTRYGPDWRGVAECVMGLASVAVQVGQPLLAARWFGAAEAALERLETTFSPTNRADYERALGALRAALKPEQLALAWQAGRAAGLQQVVDESRQLAHAPPPPRPVAGLTPRELDVARLVARGLTNRQVAEALVITEKTAANHLQRVLDKLDIRSRTHLAVRAGELGL